MQKETDMKFEDVLHNGRLWAVVYEGENQNVLNKTFADWMDIGVLRAFFDSNIKDLEQYFHITNVDEAIYDTIADAATLACVILDINPDANLDLVFRPLENHRIHEMLLSREKAKGHRQSGHGSWLRIYALKLDSGVYLATGGAIKLTPSMAEREHTLNELKRMEKVRNFLLENGIMDADGIMEDTR